MADIHIEMLKWQLLHQKTADHYTCHISHTSEKVTQEKEKFPRIYANKMHIKQDVVDFEMGDTDAKSEPDSIVRIGDDTDIAIDIAKGHTGMEAEQNEVENGITNDGDKLMEVQFVSDVDIDLFSRKKFYK